MKWFLLAWRKCTVFQGRAERTEYWMFALFGVLLWFGLCVLIGGMFGGDSLEKQYSTAWWLLRGITVTSALPLASVSARRLHDTGRSGWYQFLGFIPYVGPLALVILLSLPGTAGENRYGPAPSSPRAASPSHAADAGFRDPLTAERDRLRERFGLSAPQVDSSPTIAVPAEADFEWDSAFLSRQPWMIIGAFSVLEVCLVTGFGSWIAQRLGFDFVWLTPIAGLIYGAAGFAAARADGSPSFAGTVVAVVDVTALFLLSGVGPVVELPSRAPAVFLTSLFGAGIPGVLAAMAGGWLSKRLQPGDAA